MLAAATDVDTSLSVLRVVLSAIDANAAEGLPQSLREHVVGVLREAATIAREPHRVSAATSPEAIELAVKLLQEADLRSMLEQVAGFETVHPAMARRVLQTIEPLAAA